MHTYIHILLDFLFPLSCAGCGRGGTLLCESCTEKLSPSQKNVEGVLSFFDYRDEIVRHGIWELKYRGKHAWADVFARILNDRLAEEVADRALFSGFYNPLIVAVPLAPKRERERGYNQVALIAKQLSVGTYTPHALVRTRETESQMSIKDRTKRLKNVEDAFRASSEVVRGRNVLVLDDVTTTGATLRACRDALVAAGAHEVLLASIAH